MQGQKQLVVGIIGPGVGATDAAMANTEVGAYLTSLGVDVRTNLTHDSVARGVLENGGQLIQVFAGFRTENNWHHATPYMAEHISAFIQVDASERWKGHCEQYVKAFMEESEFVAPVYEQVAKRSLEDARDLLLDTKNHVDKAEKTILETLAALDNLT